MKFNKLPTILFAAILATATTAQAESASKQENIGVGVGSVVGTIAGGPVGFFVGATAGALIGDRMHESERREEQLSAALAGAKERRRTLESEVDGLTSEIIELGGDLSAYENGPARMALELMHAGIEMDVLFRTDEHVVSEDASARIGELARYLALVPGVSIQLDGYADPRGPVSHNQQLSLRRAETVREIMLGAGLEESQIDVIGHGATSATEVVTDPDGLALERRVIVRFFVDPANGSDGRLAGL